MRIFPKDATGERDTVDEVLRVARWFVAGWLEVSRACGFVVESWEVGSFVVSAVFLLCLCFRKVLWFSVDVLC